MRSKLHLLHEKELGVKTATGMLAFIGWDIEFKIWQVILQLSRTLVRPHLEYSAQFWSSYDQKDMEALERGQKIFHQMLPGREGISYEERL